jgi:hypothetical protein
MLLSELALAEPFSVSWPDLWARSASIGDSLAVPSLHSLKSLLAGSKLLAHIYGGPTARQIQARATLQRVTAARSMSCIMTAEVRP